MLKQENNYLGANQIQRTSSILPINDFALTSSRGGV